MTQNKPSLIFKNKGKAVKIAIERFYIFNKWWKLILESGITFLLSRSGWDFWQF